MHKIVICGPESTGKTTLCRELAEHYQTTWVPEFAREYIGRLNRKYTYDDVEIIAKKQIQQWESISHDENNLVFLILV
jgi:nicotinamide riboside kinase